MFFYLNEETEVSETAKNRIVKLTNVRAAFLNIWTPRAPKDGKGKAAYSANLIMTRDHPDLPAVKAALLVAAQEAWGEKANEILAQLVAGNRVCLYNGDAKAQFDGFAGNLYLSARGYARPTVVDNKMSADGKTPAPLTEADGRPYSGCYVNAIVEIWPQKDGQHGKRINCQLQGIQFYADGEAFGGGRVAAPDEFDVVDDSADAPAPVATGNDALALL